MHLLIPVKSYIVY